MRLLLALSSVLWAGTVFAQQFSLSKVELEAFEQIASDPATTIAWSQEAGRLETAEGTVIVTAVDLSHSGVESSGIRIDLTGGERAESVFTREEHLPRLVAAMDEIDRSAPGAEDGCRGSCEFLAEARQSAHSFAASECTIGGWTGVIVHTGDTRFPEASASDFAALFRTAQALLSNHN